MLALARVNSDVRRYKPMFRVATILIFILVSTTMFWSRSRATGQDPPREYPRENPCHVPTVECPDTYNPNSDLVFHAYVGYPRDGYTIKYRWTVRWARGLSRGRIKSGQGTDTLVVSARRGIVTATVEITGAPKECPQTASCSTMPVATVK